MSVFESDHLTNVSNYSGIFQTGVGYNKFDFVYNTGDGLFYYARENMLYGGGAQISGANRLSIVPDGPHTSEGQTHYIVDSDNQLNLLGASFEPGQIVVLQGSEQDNDGTYRVLSVEHDVNNVNGDTSLTGAVMNIVGLSSSDRIENAELESSNLLSLQEIEITPENNSDTWSKDLFFFDPDYGSTVSFRANNYKYEYGNGYYILQPKNINSLTMEVGLKFKNRTNREANAIIHFLENHQGQKQTYSDSVNLRYNQGIEGFRWDGASTFHPYDSIEVQSKKFTSSEWNHSLNFENSNDIDVKLTNIDSSILQKNSGLFVYPAEGYSSSEYYEKNDIVYNSANGSHYYWSGDSSAAGKPPSEQQSSWTREYGYHKDVNTNYWTRTFFWKPSLGLNVSEKPRMLQVGFGAGYSQTFLDGINESLLTFDLQFNNRDDSEAKAILHFLEQHYGCRPFSFVAPAPYDKDINCVCQEWSHTYNYKNNHSISAKFEQYPFNLSASQYDNIVTPSPESPGELILTSPLVMKEEGIGEDIGIDTLLRGRLKIKNIGDQPIQVDTIYIHAEFGVNFSILGQDENDVPIVKQDLDAQDYQYTLPEHSENIVLVNEDQTIDLSKKRIKLRKAFTEGLEGGYIFDLVGEPGGTFIQYNNGLIVSMDDSRNKLRTDYFINDTFIRNNKTNILNGGEESYVEILFEGIKTENLYYNLIDENGDAIQYMPLSNPDVAGGGILMRASTRYYEASALVYSSSIYSPQQAEIKVFVDI